MDISKLFLWKKEIVIKDKEGNPVRDEEDNPIILYMRIIGDNDSDCAKKFALRESKKIRTKYRKNKEEVLPDLISLTHDELASLQILNEASTIYKQAERETEIDYPNTSDSLYLEDQEKYSELIETYFDRLVTAIDLHAKELLEKQKAYYLSLSKEDLLLKVETSYISKIVEDDMAKMYTDAIMYYAVYNDLECTERTFNSIYDVMNSSSIIKEQLYAEYSNLTIRDTDLKK